MTNDFLERKSYVRSSHKQANIANFGQKVLNHYHLSEQDEQKTTFELADEFGLALKDVKLYKKMINRN